MQNETWFDKETETFEQLPSVKFKDGETKIMTFLDAGRQVLTENGERIIFAVQFEQQKMSFWLNPKNYTLRDPLAKMQREKTLIGSPIKIKREGMGKKNTRYLIVKD